MFNWRKITLEDYPMLVQWWEEWGWETPPTLDMLPQDAFLVYAGDTPLYAGFLYTTKTSIGWVEFIVSNKQAPLRLKRGALAYLLEVISIIAKSMGIISLFTSTISNGLIKVLTTSGFKIGDTNNTQLIKKL